jgi:hypothetical protein
MFLVFKNIDRMTFIHQYTTVYVSLSTEEGYTTFVTKNDSVYS